MVGNPYVVLRVFQSDGAKFPTWFLLLKNWYVDKSFFKIVKCSHFLDCILVLGCRILLPNKRINLGSRVSGTR